MKKLSNNVKSLLLAARYYVEDLIHVVKEYGLNLFDAIIGRAAKKKRKIEAHYMLELTELVRTLNNVLDENVELYTAVEKLKKKTGKKTATVAKKKIKK